MYCRSDTIDAHAHMSRCDADGFSATNTFYYLILNSALKIKNSLFFSLFFFLPKHSNNN